MVNEKQKIPTIPAVNLNVNTATVIGSQYSQLVGVTVSNYDLTLEFVYVNPKSKTEGHTVARVTMPREAAEGLANTILKTVKENDSNK